MNKRTLKIYFSLCCVVLMVFLSGCGAKVDDSSTSINASKLFVSGTLTFPTTTNPSISKSISKSASGIRVISAKVNVFLAEDFLFTNNLLKSNANVITNSQGQFILNEEDFISPNPNALGILVLRFLFENKEMFSLYDPSSSISSTPSISVDVNSDGAYRFVKEEIFYRIGGGANSSLSDSIKTELKPILKEVLSVQNKFANNLQFTGVKNSDFLVVRDQRFAGRGKQWLDKSITLDSSDVTVQNFVSTKSIIENKLLIKNTSSPTRKDAQMVLSLLDLGYFILLPDNSVLTSNRWSKLDNGSSLAYTSILNIDEILAKVSIVLSDNEKSILKAPGNIINLSISSLESLSNISPSHKQVVSKILQDFRKFPWINIQILSEFSQMSSSTLMTINKLYQSSYLNHEVLIPDGEFVSNASNDLHYFFPYGQFHSEGYTKGVSSSLQTRLSIRENLNFQSATFVDFISQDEIYLTHFLESIQKTHKEAILNGFTPTLHQDSFVAPLSKLATQNTIFKNFTESIQYTSPSIESKMIFVKKIYDWHQNKVAQNSVLSNSSTLSVMDFFYECLLESLFIFPTNSLSNLYIQQGAFETPNYRNFSHLSKNLERYTSYYDWILKDSNVQSTIDTDTGFVLWETKISELESVFERSNQINSSNENTYISGRILSNSQVGSPLSDFKLLLTDSQKNILQSTYTNGFGEFLFAPNQGPSDLNLGVELNSISNSHSQITTIFEKIRIHGWEKIKHLPDYYLLNQINSSTDSTVVLTQIQKSNQSPVVKINSSRQISKSLLELSVGYSDFESAELSFLLNYVYDGQLYRANSLKVSSQSTITNSLVSLSSSRSTTVVSIYWDLNQDLGSRFTNLSVIDSLILSMTLQEKVSSEVFAPYVTKTQILDFVEPSVRFIFPTTNSVIDIPIITSLDVEIIDQSGVPFASIINQSVLSSSRTTFNGVQDLVNRNIWHFKDITLNSGITNVLELDTVDFLSNKSLEKATHAIQSLDANPPKLWFKEISMFKSQYLPKLNVIRSYSLDGANIVTVEIPVVPEVLSNSIKYSLAQSWTRFDTNVKSIFLEMDAVTTSSIQYTLDITDENNISFYQVGTKKVFPPQSKNVSISDRINFTNEQKNYQLDISAFDVSSLQSQISLKITTLDFQGPSIFVSSPSITSLTTILSTTESIKGLSVDTSVVKTISGCIGSQCVSFNSTSTQVSWELSGLPFIEGVSNVVNISAEDIFGNVSTIAPFVYELDDVTSPSLVVTSINGVASSIIVTSGSMFSPSLIELSSCKVLHCPISVRGFVEDRSGFNFTSDGLGLFDSFKLTIPDTYSEVLSPSLSSANSVAHHSIVSISNQQSQSALFHLSASIVNDGIWPVRLFLNDNYTGKYAGYSKKPLEKKSILYFKKDRAAPVVDEFQLDTSSLVVGGQFKVRGKISDQLSPIITLDINGVASSFLTSTSLSSWNSIITLPAKSSITFEKVLTAVSGMNTVILTASDSFGNSTTASLNFNIFPIFQSLKSSFKNIFTSPTDMDFTGTGLSSVLISQKENPSLSLVGVGFQSIRGVTGSTNSDYSKIKQLHSFASFTSLDGNYTTQSLLAHGHFDGIFSDVNRTIHMKRDLNNQSGTFLSYVSEGEDLDNGDHQVYRNIAVVSGAYINLTSSSLFEYSPFLPSVTYSYSATSTSLTSQLYRYVNGVQTKISPIVISSTGGSPSSTGFLGSGDFQLPSTISTMRVTQSFVINSVNKNNLDVGSEVIHLLDSANNKILRQHFDTKTTHSFQALSPLTLPYSPVAFELSVNGDIFYIADSNLKIHKYKRESTDALTLLTSFGGHGLRDGQFLSINSIRGLQRTSHQGIEEIWVVDEKSSRLSSFTSSGVFISHYLQNPNKIGAQQDIVDMDFTPNNELFVVDQGLAAIDFYDKDLQNNYRISLDSLGQGLLRTEVHAGFTKWLEQSYSQAILNQENPLYFTSSYEKLKASTRTVYVMVPSKKSMYSMVETSDSYFRSILDNGLRVLQYQTSRSYSSISTISDFEFAFENVIDIDVSFDTDNHILTLENVNSQNARIQYRKADGVATPDTHTFLNQQSDAVDFCRFDKGIASIGNSPKNKIDIYLFRSNPILNRTGSVSSENILDYNKISVGLNAPKSIACHKDQVAIIDGNIVKTYTINIDVDNSVEILQKANLDYFKEANLNKRLSGPKELALNDDYLYVVDELNSIMKYRLK